MLKTMIIILVLTSTANAQSVLFPETTLFNNPGDQHLNEVYLLPPQPRTILLIGFVFVSAHYRRK